MKTADAQLVRRAVKSISAGNKAWITITSGACFGAVHTIAFVDDGGLVEIWFDDLPDQLPGTALFRPTDLASVAFFNVNRKTDTDADDDED